MVNGPFPLVSLLSYAISYFAIRLIRVIYSSGCPLPFLTHSVGLFVSFEPFKGIVSFIRGSRISEMQSSHENTREILHRPQCEKWIIVIIRCRFALLSYHFLTHPRIWPIRLTLYLNLGAITHCGKHWKLVYSKKMRETIIFSFTPTINVICFFYRFETNFYAPLYIG